MSFWEHFLADIFFFMDWFALNWLTLIAYFPCACEVYIHLQAISFDGLPTI